MVGAGAGTKITQRANANVRAAARVCNSVMARSTAEARLLVEHLTDQGILEDDHGPPTCTRPDCSCVIGSKDLKCPCCGAEVGERLEVVAESPDEEILIDEEKPVHAVEVEIYKDITEPLDLPECLQEALMELRWNLDDAEEAGMILANIWPDMGPSDEGEYEKGLATLDSSFKKRLLEPETVNRIVQQFQHCHDEETDTALSIQAELRIFQEGDEWLVEVDDPLRDKIATSRKRRIQVGDFTIPEALTLKILQDRANRLPKLGKALAFYRKDFFEADNADDADAVLRKKGCTQKDVANKAGIPRSTLCRWCDERTGVWVDTPHGVYHLRDFFGRKVKVISGEDLRKATVLGLILDAKRGLRENGLENITRDTVVEWLGKNGHELMMEPRTQRWYFEQAEIMEKVIKGKEDLSKEQQSISKISENMDGFSKHLKQKYDIDLNEKKLRFYLDMALIYEDHSS